MLLSQQESNRLQAGWSDRSLDGDSKESAS
jgi:hypothetical protein